MSALVPTDVPAVLAELGIRPRRETYLEVWALCPNPEHNDSSPSWSVNTETGLHSCFSCEYAGSFDSLVADMLDLSAWDARGWLLEHTVNELALERLPTYAETSTTRRRREGSEINEARLVDFYRPPLDALAERGISAEAADHFGVLWDCDGEGWVLPVRQPDGRLLGWQVKTKHTVRNYPARALDEDGVAKSVTLFGADVFVPGTTALLVESPLDCLRAWDCGLDGLDGRPKALGAYGAKVSREQVRMLSTLTDHALLALDDDPTGRRMTRRLVHGALQDGAWATAPLPASMRVGVFAYGRPTDDPDDPWGTGPDPEVTDIGEMADAAVLWGVEHAVGGVVYPGTHLTLPSKARRSPRPARRQRARPRRL